MQDSDFQTGRCYSLGREEGNKCFMTMNNNINMSAKGKFISIKKMGEGRHEGLVEIKRETLCQKV